MSTLANHDAPQLDPQQSVATPSEAETSSPQGAASRSTARMTSKNSAGATPRNLAELSIGASAVVTRVGGHGSFRRRLMEHGILPGTRVELLRVAPLGDPLELLVRGASLSIRRAEALTVEVTIESSSRSNREAALER